MPRIRRVVLNPNRSHFLRVNNYQINSYARIDLIKLKGTPGKSQEVSDFNYSTKNIFIFVPDKSALVSRLSLRVLQWSTHNISFSRTHIISKTQAFEAEKCYC